MSSIPSNLSAFETQFSQRNVHFKPTKDQVILMFQQGMLVNPQFKTHFENFNFNLVNLNEHYIFVEFREKLFGAQHIDWRLRQAKENPIQIGICGDNTYPDTAIIMGFKPLSDSPNAVEVQILAYVNTQPYFNYEIFKGPMHQDWTTSAGDDVDFANFLGFLKSINSEINQD